VRTGSTRLAAFAGGAAPENFTGEISRFKPDCVVLVDAAHLGPGRAPGEIDLIAPEQVGGLAFSTHMLPVPIFLDYLRATTGCRTVVIGLQVAQKDVLAPLTPAVAAGVRRLVSALRRAVAEVADVAPRRPRAPRSARPRRRRGGAR
jgi:hydrogenase 3 maturation protease